MDSKRTFSMFMINVLLVVCMSMSAVQSMASFGRFGIRVIQESNFRMRYLNSAEIGAYEYAAELLSEIVSLKSHRVLLGQLCHRWLGDTYKKSIVFTSHDQQMRDFMHEWSKSHPDVSLLKHHEIQNKMHLFVQPGQFEVAAVIATFCHAEMASQYQKCRSFGEAFLARPMPPELSALTCECIDEVSERWLRCSMPLPEAGESIVEGYRKDCGFVLQSSRDFEIQFGRNMSDIKKQD